MSKVRLRKKYRIKYQEIILFTICSISFIFGICFFYNLQLYSSNEEFISKILTDSNHYKKYNNKFFNKLTSIIYSSSIDKPSSMIASTFSSKDSFNYDEEYNADKLEKISKHIDDPNPENIENPIVYIYNSHQLENYNSNNYEAYNITPNVMMASYIMKEKLNKLGIPSIVENADITEFMRLNNWNYNYSYQASRYYIESAIENNKFLKYFIDIHRDSTTKNNSTAVINGKSYAQVLFVVGLEHDNYNANLDFTNSINDKIKLKYPLLTKGVLTKKGANVNGIYNQDVSPNSILIEIGGYESEIDEVYNTVEILSTILKEIINET